MGEGRKEETPAHSQPLRGAASYGVGASASGSPGRLAHLGLTQLGLLASAGVKTNR